MQVTLYVIVQKISSVSMVPHGFHIRHNHRGLVWIEGEELSVFMQNNFANIIQLFFLSLTTEKEIWGHNTYTILPLFIPILLRS